MIKRCFLFPRRPSLVHKYKPFGYKRYYAKELKASDLNQMKKVIEMGSFLVDRDMSGDFKDSETIDDFFMKGLGGEEEEDNKPFYIDSKNPKLDYVRQYGHLFKKSAKKKLIHDLKKDTEKEDPHFNEEQFIKFLEGTIKNLEDKITQVDLMEKEGKKWIEQEREKIMAGKDEYIKRRMEKDKAKLEKQKQKQDKLKSEKLQEDWEYDPIVKQKDSLDQLDSDVVESIPKKKKSVTSKKDIESENENISKNKKKKSEEDINVVKKKSKDNKKYEDDYY